MGLLNVDLFSVAISVAGISVLGFVIYFSNPTSVTARTFLGFSLVTILWSIANYLQYQPTGEELGLTLVRAIVCLATWHAFLFFQLCMVFPRKKFAFPLWYMTGAPILTAAISFMTLTPLVFQKVETTTAQGTVISVVNGPGIAIFSGYVALLIISGIAIIVHKTLRESGVVRRQLLVIGTGMVLSFTAIVTFNLILPAFFNDPRFLPLSSVFMFPFIAFVAYALLRYEILSVKVVATELFVFLLAISAAAQVVFSSGLSSLLFHASTFILTLVFSILLVQSVIKEVRLRETIEQQKKDLDVVNAQQVALLHFISHEVKATLNKAQGIFAGLIDGDYGPLSDGVRDIATQSLQEVRAGIAMVMDVLDASNLKRGTMSFEKKRFDVRVAVEKVIDSAKPLAQKKGLHLEFVIPPAGTLEIEGDETKLSRHVFRNLIENAIYYTQRGFVRISLSRIGNVVRFSVEDSGIGITPEDMARLFTEGGRGTDSLKFNVNSTGYGLFIAKSIVNAHRGTIKAESAGAGKGSRFIVELPI